MAGVVIEGPVVEEDIRVALLRLMRKKPYNKITVAEIARVAGVDRATCYRHFDNKDAIVTSYYDDYLTECVERFRRSGGQDMGTYLACVFSVALERKDDMLAVYRAGAAYLLLDVLSARFRLEVFTRADEPLAQYAVAYHVGGIYNDMLLWFGRDMRESAAQMTRVALASRTRGDFTLLNF
jgi:AcrR family transcriptional regulator